MGARAEVPRPVGRFQLLAGRLPVAAQCIGLAGLAVGPPVLLIHRCGFDSHRVDCRGRSTRLFETPASHQAWATTAPPVCTGEQVPFDIRYQERLALPSHNISCKQTPLEVAVSSLAVESGAAALMSPYWVADPEPLSQRVAPASRPQCAASCGNWRMCRLRGLGYMYCSELRASLVLPTRGSHGE
jgi:hypothetical protein